jgi:A/G-specific adenine glycosylase
MRALPDDGWHAGADGCGAAPLPGEWRASGQVEHTFTHFHLTLGLRVYSGDEVARLDATTGQWWPLSRIGEAGLPTLYAKAARLALGLREKE